MPIPEDDGEDDSYDDGDDSFLRKVAHAPAVAAHPDMLVGTVVAERFRVEELAGKGGMGAVYRSSDLETNEPVAVKVLVREVAGEALDRFVREASILSTLRHPSVVRYVAHGRTTRDEPYLAMEWLAGETLAARLARGPLSVDETKALGAQVAGALGVAHDRGILHRDVKPQNLFLVAGTLELVKLLDFGLAKPSGGGHRMTRTGTSVGTPAYMSPEQARGAKVIDDRADIFGLGATLFECLSGRPPFVAKDVPTLLGKILFEETPRVRTLRADVPAELDLLLARMLAKEPAQRPRHREIVAALG